MFKRILHPTDFTPVAHQALEQAVSLAKLYGAELRIVHAMTLRGYDSELLSESLPLVEKAKKAVAEELTRRLDRLLAGSLEDLPPYEAVLRRGSAPAEAIVEEAREWGADLIVMGTHGAEPMRKLFLGSVAERVVRYGPCPTMVLGREEDVPGRFERVLLPVDFSAASIQAAALASSICRKHGAKLHLTHVYEDIAPPPYLVESLFKWDPGLFERGRQALERFREQHIEGVGSAKIHLVEGRPARKIVELTRKHPIDLVVMGIHGAKPIHRFFVGSVTSRVLRRATVPVLTTRDGREG